MKKFVILFVLLLVFIPVFLYIVKSDGSKKANSPLPVKSGTKVVTPTSSKNYAPVTPVLSKTQTAPAVKPQAGFMDSSQIGFPGGFSFARAMNAKEDIGKNSFYYDYNPVALDGTEWVTTKNVNSLAEYQAAIKSFHDYYTPKIYQNGWTNQQIVDGHNLQPLSAESPGGEVVGYLKYANGNVQVILFYDQKESNNYPLNVQFRLFISNVYSLKVVTSK